MKKQVLTFLYILISIISFSQQTPYEKKKYELSIKFFQKLGIDESYLKNAKDLSGVESIMVSSILINSLISEQGIILLSQYNQELKAAENLKGSIDFQREKEKKEKERMKALQQEIEYKKMQLIKEKKEKHDNLDIVKIKENVIENVKDWFKKNEFEKSEQYEKRIINEAYPNFERINFEAIESRIAYLIYSKKDKPYFELGPYNADNEQFKISISFRDLKWNQNINIPLTLAPLFKENFDFNDSKTSFLNWGVYDNNFYPSKIILTSKSQSKSFEFIPPMPNWDDYRVTTNDLGLNKIGLTDMKFSYFGYKEKLLVEQEKWRVEKEKQKQIEEIRLTEENKKAKKLKEFQGTDFGDIIDEIKNEFSKWEIKAPFESDLEYNTRLQNERNERLNYVSKKITSNYNQLNDSLIKDNLCVLGEINNYDSERKVFKLKPSISYFQGRPSINISSTYNEDLTIRYISLFLKSDFTIPISSKLANEILDKKDQIQIRVVPQKFILYDNNFKISEAYIVIGLKGSSDKDNYFTKFNISSNQISVEDISFESQKGKDFSDIPILALIKKKPNNIKTRKLENLNTLEKDFNIRESLPIGVYYYLWKLETDFGYDKNKVRELSNMYK